MSQQPAGSGQTGKNPRARRRRSRAFFVWIWTHKFPALALGALLLLSTIAALLAPTLTSLLGLPALASLMTVQIAAVAVTALYTIMLLWSRRVYHVQYRGKRDAKLKPFKLRRVSELNKSDYVPAYASVIDRNHPTARLVRHALRTAERSSLSRARVLSVAPLPVGVCIFGEPLQDKTGLAWAAMQEVLPGWTFVSWPHVMDPAHDIVKQSGERVVLWLDDLHEYGNRLESVTLDDLIDRFAEAHIQVVVVATCRWHEDEREARAHLGYLLDHLLPIRLATKPGDRSEDPVVLQPTMDQPIIPSGTPPKSLQDLIIERTKVYHALIASEKPEDKGARAVLRALALLRSAGILVYTQRRVRAIAAEFGLESGDADFRKALKHLVQLQFIQPMPELIDRKGMGKFVFNQNNRLRGIKPEKGADILPVSEWYLERVVAVEEKQAEDPGEALLDIWEALRPLKDTAALILLGDAYLDPRRPYLRNSATQAIQCYETARDALDAIERPVQWATAQIGLGNAYMVEAGRTARKGRSTPLKKALDAYTIVTKTADLPARVLYAEAWQGVGNAQRAMAVDATQANDPNTAIAHLVEAEKAFTTSIELYKQAHSPSQWALTHYELATVQSEQAKLEADRGAAKASLDHLTKAEASFRQAREVYTRTTAPTDWAKIQGDLGTSLLALNKQMLATTPPTTLKDRLAVLQQAVDTLRAAMTTFRLFRMDENWASVSVTLAEALVAEAEALKSTAEPKSAELDQRQDTLTQAVEAYTAALQYYRPESAPLQWGAVQTALAQTYLQQAEVANLGFGASDANIKAASYRSQAKLCVEQALNVLYRAPFGAPFDTPGVLPEMQQRLKDANALLRLITN
jgi:tetratricopeptide (TPR) repeat protein